MSSPEEIRVALHDLAAGPPALGRLVNRAPREAWDLRDPELGGWSAREIVAHLADLEFNLHFTARVARILQEDEPVLDAAEADWRALVHRHRNQEPAVALGAYTMARKHMIAVLLEVGPAAWDRAGLHPEAGRVTLLEVVRGFARHDRRPIDRVRELFALLPTAD